MLPTKPSGTVVGAVNVRIGGDGVYEIEAGAGDGAGLGGVGRAVQVCEGWEADESDEGEPVAGGSVGGDGAQAQGAEGGGAEGFEGIKGGEEWCGGFAGPGCRRRH